MCKNLEQNLNLEKRTIRLCVFDFILNERSLLLDFLLFLWRSSWFLLFFHYTPSAYSIKSKISLPQNNCKNVFDVFI